MTVPEGSSDRVCRSCGAYNYRAFLYCENCGQPLNVAGEVVRPSGPIPPAGSGPAAGEPVPTPPPAAFVPTLTPASRLVPPPPPPSPTPTASDWSGKIIQPQSGPGGHDQIGSSPAPPSPLPPSSGDSYEVASIRLGPYPSGPSGRPGDRAGLGPEPYAAPAPAFGGPGAPFGPPGAPLGGPRPPGAVPITMHGLGRADGSALAPADLPWPGPAPVPTFRPDARPGQWSQGDLIAGRFLVHRKIVSGMGVVYLCFDQQASEPVAIKTYLDTVFGPTRHPNHDESALAQQFESEALLWMRLGKHPHVVQARYVLRLAGKPHIFLEYVPGPAGGESTVRRLLKDGPVDVATALLLAIQTCAGMEHALSVFPGFVHRDLKPENLLLTTEHVLKVTDFGLTRVFADFSGEVGVVAGTPPYMSPEQCLGLPSLDTRSDIYSLGVILYELLAGRRPFLASDIDGHLRAHLLEQPASPRSIVAGVPATVEALVLRCLQKRPEDRFASFGELHAALTACYQEVTGGLPALPDPAEADDAVASGIAGVELARAISLVTLGRYEEAMTFFDLAVEHDPSLARAWYFRGLALNGLGRFDEALACLDRVVALEPRDPNAWVEKGRALTRDGQRDAALGCFDRAIAINPWHLGALYEKGACLLFLGRFAEAAACISEVAAIQPGPGVEAARAACLAGQRLAESRPVAGPSSTYIRSLDDLDMRT